MELYTIVKLVQGSFHQGHTKFGETAGRQCVCNALLAIAWSKIKKVSLWRSADLDYILIQGDFLYKSLCVQSYIDVDDIPERFNIDSHPVRVQKLDLYENEATYQASFLLQYTFPQIDCVIIFET